MRYLCYDVKGIQSFIFAVPRLKYIVGGSILIDEFDRVTIPRLACDEANRLFSGGGKGVFTCKSQMVAQGIKTKILAAAHDVGLSVAIGESDDYSEAAQCADRFYPFMPSENELDGHPCSASGLYPVVATPQSDGTHPVIQKRIFQKRNLIRRQLENRLLTDFNIPQVTTQAQNGLVEFFHDISDENDEGRRALGALGGRHRWAIICMDGNDIGSQFRHFNSTNPSETEMQEWVRAMSESLDKCSLHASSQACQEVIRQWASDQRRVENATTSDGTVILPIRPVVVGGDDIVVLCHAGYAIDFVKEACRAFSEESIRQGESHPNLWSATGGRLTISAGVLFCPIPLPLHMAIPYTESLLGSAKGEGRKHAQDGHPSPACIDFEVITETMLDTVADRRNRELRFIDGDSGAQIELTQKPYRLDDFLNQQQQIQNLQKIPRSIRQQLLPSLRAGESDRMIFRSRIRKRHPGLYERLDESTWNTHQDQVSKLNVLSTPLIDQFEILEEMHRMSQSEEVGQ